MQAARGGRGGGVCGFFVGQVVFNKDDTSCHVVIYVAMPKRVATCSMDFQVFE